MKWEVLKKRKKIADLLMQLISNPNRNKKVLQPQVTFKRKSNPRIWQ